MIAVFDIGGTSIKYGVIDEMKIDLTFLFQDSFASNAKVEKGPGILHNLIIRVTELQKSYRISGIAISTAGMVDATTGRIVYANENIPDYTGMKLKEVLEETFHVPCWVENDVNAAALGEAMYGAGKHVQDLIMLTIGTGIGGALILQRKVYHGHSRGAGEIGYMMVNGKEFQDVASTSALVQHVEQRMNTTGLDGKFIFDRAKQGDKICKEEIEQQCATIMQGVSNCVCLMNPEMVILGGGIMAQMDYLKPIMEHYTKQYIKDEMRKHVVVTFAELGNQAGMAGAYAYFMEKEGKDNA